MTDSSANGSEAILNALLVNSTPKRATANIREFFVRIDRDFVEMSGQIHHKTTLGRRCCRNAVPASANSDGEIVGGCVADCGSDVEAVNMNGLSRKHILDAVDASVGRLGTYMSLSSQSRQECPDVPHA